MNDLIVHSGLWVAAGTALLAAVFAIAPDVSARVLVQAYPKHHPRRRELQAEMAPLSRGCQIIWLFGTLHTAAADGLRDRLRGVRFDPDVPAESKRESNGSFKVVNKTEYTLSSIELSLEEKLDSILVSNFVDFGTKMRPCDVVVNLQGDQGPAIIFEAKRPNCRFNHGDRQLSPNPSI